MSEIIIVNKEEIDALRADILELKKLLLAGQQTSTSKDGLWMLKSQLTCFTLLRVHYILGSKRAL